MNISGSPVPAYISKTPPGSPSTRLMRARVSLCALHGESLVVLFGSCGTLTGGRVGPALAGCLAVAAAPMFIAMTHQYLVEPLQCLAVAWFVGIMAFAGQWRRTTLVAHLLGATAFAMLAKV